MGPLETTKEKLNNNTTHFFFTATKQMFLIVIFVAFDVCSHSYFKWFHVILFVLLYCFLYAVAFQHRMCKSTHIFASFRLFRCFCCCCCSFRFLRCSYSLFVFFFLCDRVPFHIVCCVCMVKLLPNVVRRVVRLAHIFRFSFRSHFHFLLMPFDVCTCLHLARSLPFVRITFLVFVISLVFFSSLESMRFSLVLLPCFICCLYGINDRILILMIWIVDFSWHYEFKCICIIPAIPFYMVLLLDFSLYRSHPLHVHKWSKDLQLRIVMRCVFWVRE